MTCRPGRSREDRTHGPAGASSAEGLVLAAPGSLDGPAASARHRGRDHDQDGRDDDADDPPDPVDAARRLNPERCGEVVADEHAADPADNRQPEWNVVAVAWREELAQQADDDAGDDHTDDVHRRPLSPVGDGLVPRRSRVPVRARAQSQMAIMAQLRVADHSLNTCRDPPARPGTARLIQLGSSWRLAVTWRSRLASCEPASALVHLHRMRSVEPARGQDREGHEAIGPDRTTPRQNEGVGRALWRWRLRDPDQGPP